MKKVIVMLIMCVFATAMCACSDNITADVSDKRGYSIPCAEGSGDDTYVITYAEEKIMSETGAFTIENRSGFDIVVHISANGGAELTAAVEAGGTAVLENVEKGVAYTVGCHADVDEGVEMKFDMHD